MTESKQDEQKDRRERVISAMGDFLSGKKGQSKATRRQAIAKGKALQSEVVNE